MTELFWFVAIVATGVVLKVGLLVGSTPTPPKALVWTLGVLLGLLMVALVAPMWPKWHESWAEAFKVTVLCVFGYMMSYMVGINLGMIYLRRKASKKTQDTAIQA